MLDKQTIEQQKVTLVGAVYRTVVASNRAFQQLTERQLDERKAEESQRIREMMSPTKAKPPADTGVIVDVKQAQAPAVAAPAPIASPAPKSAAIGNTIDLQA